MQQITQQKPYWPEENGMIYSKLKERNEGREGEREEGRKERKKEKIS
jgi:hypothetical protein